MIVETKDPEYWYIGNLLEGNRDEKLLQHVEERFGKNSNRASAVFLTGTDLNTRDYKKSREAICFRRRVFLADLLYARGACMLAQDSREQNLIFPERADAFVQCADPQQQRRKGRALYDRQSG